MHLAIEWNYIYGHLAQDMKGRGKILEGSQSVSSLKVPSHKDPEVSVQKLEPTLIIIERL